MKWIFLLLLGIGCTAMAAAQQNKANLPPVKTSESVPVQNKVKADLPIRKADNATQRSTTATETPIRKSDMGGSSAPVTVTNKTTTDNSKTKLPSDAAVPKKPTETQLKKQ